MNISLTVDRVKRWGLKGGMAILDQGVFSGGNFFISVFLAKALSSKDFGAFAVGFAVLTFFMQVYTSFALEPMSILGPYNYRDGMNSYLLAQVRLLFLLSIPTSILLGLIIWLNQVVGKHSATTSVLIFSVFSLPFILFPLLMRRIFYVLLKPGWALFGSVIYFSALIVFLSLTNRFGFLDGETSVIIFSLAGLISGSALLWLLRNENSLSNRIDLLTILTETWSFGKWLILSGALIGLATQSQIYLTGVLSSLEDAGAVRILQTFIQPMMLASTAFSALATPAITADFASGAYKAMRRKMLQFTVVLGAIALVYELLLILFSASLNEILFDGRYSSLMSEIPIWGIGPILLSFSWGGAISLQASQKPQAMLIISGSWAIFSLVPALILVPTWGAWGATVSFVVGFAAAFLSTWLLYWLWVDWAYMNETRSS